MCHKRHCLVPCGLHLKVSSFVPLALSLSRLVCVSHSMPSLPSFPPSPHQTHAQIPEEVTAYFLQQAGVTVTDPKM